MKEYPLSIEEQMKYGANMAFLLDYTDLTDTAGLTKTIALSPAAGSIGVGWSIRTVKQKVITAFVGCATLGCELGDANSVARYQASNDLKATAGTWNVTPAAALPYAFASTDGAVKAKFTATTNNLSVLTAGKLLILIHLVNLNDFPQAK